MMSQQIGERKEGLSMMDFSSNGTCSLVESSAPRPLICDKSIIADLKYGLTRAVK